MIPKFRLLQAAVISSTAMLAACNSSNDSFVNSLGYEAEVYRTEGGFPHIQANDFGSLGFGTGYAAAQDNICFLAEDFLKYNAERAKYFGAGFYNSNQSSDAFYQYLADTGVFDVEASPELEAMFAGYAAGFNRYLNDTGTDDLPEQCQGADWVKPVEIETIRRVHATPYFLSNFSPMVTAARPPVVVAKSKEPIAPLQITYNNPAMDPMIGNIADKGSNGVAIGSDHAIGANALLFANPHLDWKNENRFYPMHQVIPDVVNLLGANAINRSSVGFGTNGDVAWTNTVSKSQRYSFYRLALVPGQPTRYYLDDEQKDMTQTQVKVIVKNESGELEEKTHTFYGTDLGLMIFIPPSDSNPGFPWVDGSGFALRVAGEDDRGMKGGLIANFKAKSVEDLKNAQDKYQHMPVNLIAADNTGKVLFHEGGPVAGITDAQKSTCEFYGILDGASSSCQWTNSPTAAAEGLLPPEQQPFLIRSDYVANSNDTYWLANPEEKLTGFPKIVGEAEKEQTPRTRSGLTMIEKRLNGTDENGSPGFTRDSLLNILMSNQHYVGQILRDDIVAMCEATPSVTLEGIQVSLINACNILKDWNLTSELESVGSHIMREFIAIAMQGESGRIMPSKYNYTVVFDAEDPVNTPRGLDTTNNPEVLTDLAKAVKTLKAAGIALDAKLGDIQSVDKNGIKIPMHGGQESEGIFNKMGFGNATAEGYKTLSGSSASWVMATALTDNGPEVKALLTYSISTNPDSPHYSDQTERFSNKEFIEIPYHMDDVKAQATESMTLTQRADSCFNDGWQENIAGFTNVTSCLAHYRKLAADRLTSFIE